MINWQIFKKTLAEMIYPSSSLKCPVKESEREKYYNNKYPKEEIVYSGRFVPNTKDNISIDVRNFFDEYDVGVQKVVKGLSLGRLSDDEKALRCLNWVKSKIKYVKDREKAKREYWQFAFESLHYKTGDCEDGAILLANLLLSSGISYWKIRISAGKVKGGSHAYVTYYCESKKRWVVLDWCYWFNGKAIKDRLDYSDEKNYYGVWFSWNRKYSFSKGLNSDAKHLLKK